MSLRHKTGSEQLHVFNQRFSEFLYYLHSYYLIRITFLYVYFQFHRAMVRTHNFRMNLRFLNPVFYIV